MMVRKLKLQKHTVYTLCAYAFVSLITAFVVYLSCVEGLGLSINRLRLTYQHGEVLWLLPLLAALFIFSRIYHPRTRSRMRVSDLSMLETLRETTRGGGRAIWVQPIADAMQWVAMILLVIALARPQSIHEKRPTAVEGIDIVLVLDLSFSMQASDIAPNRFEAMKSVVNAFVQNRPNDRIGAVVFGREAFTLLPLTSDHTALQTVLTELELGSIDGKGTAIGNAMGTALNRLRESKAESRVMILLTDGDSNSGNISPEQAVHLASLLSVKVYPILMGQNDDAKIKRGVDLFGRPIWDKGTFPINPELLRRMAHKTEGKYYSATDRKELEASFYSILDRLKKSEIQDVGRIRQDIYMILLWPALILLTLAFSLHVSILRRWP